MKTILLLLLSLLIINTATAEDTPSPVPAEGGDEVGGGYVPRTLSPTIDMVAYTGRGRPTQLPTLEPTFPPTDKGFGSDVQIDVPDYPVSGGQPNNAGVQEEASPDTPTIAAATTAEASEASGTLRIESATSVYAVAGGSMLAMLGFL